MGSEMCIRDRCRHLEHGLGSYATELANWIVSFVGGNQAMRKSTVKEVVKEGMALVMNYILAEVTSESVYCVKDVREILHRFIGNEEIAEQRANKLFEKVKHLIHGRGSPLMMSLHEAVTLFRHFSYHQHKLLFVLSDGHSTDGHDPVSYTHLTLPTIYSV